MKTLTLQEKAAQWFENNFDCYADTWKNIGQTPTGHEMVEGEVIQAITKAKFLEFLTEATTLFAEQDKWVSVTERLPEEDMFCLVRLKPTGMVVRYYNEFHKCWDDESGDDHFTDAINDRVTHWQPLPAAPKV